MTAARPRLAVLVSGGGRSLQNLVEWQRRGELAADVVLAVSSSARAHALERARALGVPAVVVAPRRHATEAAFAEALYGELAAARADFAVLAGFLAKVPVPPEWRGRILNIHPALLPAFGGKGCYGHHVHEAVWRSGVRVSGCTVHFVDEEYDHGPIVLQRTVVVEFADTPDSIAARVFEQEQRALPEAVNLLVRGRLRIAGGRVEILP